VAVLVQYLRRAKQPTLERSVWLGAALGTALSVLLGVILLTIYYITANSIDDEAASYLEGSMLLFASIMITYFFVTHLAPGMKSKDKWESKWERRMHDLVEDAVEKKSNRNFFCLTFTSVFREGIEAIIFIIGIGSVYSPVGLILPSICGLLVGCMFGFMMFMGSKQIDLGAFFVGSAVFLLFVAAGLAAHGSYEWQKAGLFGTWACVVSGACAFENVLFLPR